RLEENFEMGSNDDGTTDGSTPVLELSASNNSWAAAIPRPGGASGAFCVDSDGDSYGYNNVGGNPSSVIVDDSGEGEGTSSCEEPSQYSAP
ncbi:MAG: hypothetical protein ABEI13_01360, partial [Candidatus Paceibacteria bacterium]